MLRVNECGDAREQSLQIKVEVTNGTEASELGGDFKKDDSGCGAICRVKPRAGWTAKSWSNVVLYLKGPGRNPRVPSSSEHALEELWMWEEHGQSSAFKTKSSMKDLRVKLLLWPVSNHWCQDFYFNLPWFYLITVKCAGWGMARDRLRPLVGVLLFDRSTQFISYVQANRCSCSEEIMLLLLCRQAYNVTFGRSRILKG